jgi:hypothetical protein
MILNHLATATGFRFTLLTETLSDSEFNPALAESTGPGIDADELVTKLKEEFDATEVARTAE